MGKHDLHSKDYEYITVCTTAANIHIRLVSSKSEFFNNEIKVIYFDDHIIFRLAGLSDKKIMKASKDVHGFYHVTIKSKCPNGKYYFDKEESTEDEKVVYFN